MENYLTYTKEERIDYFLNKLKAEPRGFAYISGKLVEWTPDFVTFNVGTDEVESVKNNEEDIRKTLNEELDGK